MVIISKRFEFIWGRRYSGRGGSEASGRAAGRAARRRRGCGPFGRGGGSGLPAFGSLKVAKAHRAVFSPKSASQQQPSPVAKVAAVGFSGNGPWRRAVDFSFVRLRERSCWKLCCHGEAGTQSVRAAGSAGTGSQQRFEQRAGRNSSRRPRHRTSPRALFLSMGKEGLDRGVVNNVTDRRHFLMR